MKFLDAELALLRGNVCVNESSKNEDSRQLHNLVSLINKGDLECVITHPVARRLCPMVTSMSELDELQTRISSVVKEFVTCDDKDLCTVRQCLVLCVAVAHIQYFVQHNWLGPVTKFDWSSLILSQSAKTEEYVKLLQDDLIDRLSVDGEVCYNLLRQPVCLLLARYLLVGCQEWLQDVPSADLWRLHCLWLHQRTLDNRVFSLKTAIVELMDRVSQQQWLKADEYSDLAIQYHLEAVYLSIYYYRYKHGQEHLDEAVKLSRLSADLTGAMGKRTKFQQNDIAQLVVRVQRTDDVRANDPTPDLTPVDVALDDETVLNQMKLTEPVETEEKPTMVEQSVLLAMCMYNKRNSPDDEITGWQTAAYLTYIIAHSTNWSVKSTALYFRCLQEQGSFRRQMRCMSQLEELVHQFSRLSPSVSQRLHIFHSVDMLPTWLVERAFGQLLYKLGSHNAALDVFERLHLWEDVIRCYGALGRTEKAEQLIREQLAVRPTPILYCYLGDVTRDIDNYQKAWDLSKGHSARAMRSLGYHYLKKEQYEECVACFEKTLHVNRLQRDAWFSYGCASMLLQKLPQAANAFRCCLEVDFDNAQAWNNLGSIYVKMNEKVKALKVYKEAVKYDYENWRIWHNHMTLSTDCGDFSGLILAYERLLDIKGRFTDGEVLRILVRAVNEDIPDWKGVPGSSLRWRVNKFFGKITSKVTSESEVWQCYAELVSGQPELTQEDKEKAAQLLQKAQRCVTQQLNWQKEVEKCRSVSEMTLKVVNSYQRCCEGLEDKEHVKKLLSSARLLVKGVLSNIKQAQIDPVTLEMNSEVAESAEKLEKSLQTVMGLLDQ